MIRIRGITFLSGSSFRDPESGKWSLIYAAPRYMNTYEVVEFDATGEEDLLRMQARALTKDDAPPPTEGPVPPPPAQRSLEL